MLTAPEALDRLRSGNERFLAGASDLHEPVRRVAELAEGQAPFAVVLGCSDSRVPVELVFDQGLGDLFVIRVAGNVAAPSQIGSIEYAAAQLGARLVVVLGHTRCGAVAASVDAAPGTTPEGHLGSIVERVLPAVHEARAARPGAGHEDLVREAVRANVRASVRSLLEDSPVLARLAAEDGLSVVGAEYALETGRVEFLEDGS